MLVLPTIKTIEINGNPVRYSVPKGIGKVEAERASSFGPPGLVFSEYIASDIGLEIAKVEGKRYVPCRGGNSVYSSYGRVL